MQRGSTTRKLAGKRVDRGRRILLRDREFHAYFAAQQGTPFGYSIETVAIGWQVYGLHHPPRHRLGRARAVRAAVAPRDSRRNAEGKLG
jgi:hypothetical protein